MSISKASTLNWLPNEHLESFYSTLWLGIRTVLNLRGESIGHAWPHPKPYNSTCYRIRRALCPGRVRSRRDPLSHVIGLCWIDSSTWSIHRKYTPKCLGPSFFRFQTFDCNMLCVQIRLQAKDDCVTNSPC